MPLRSREPANLAQTTAADREESRWLEAYTEVWQLETQQSRLANLQSMESARQRLRHCLAELKQLANESSGSKEQFSLELIRKLIPALAATAGAVWLRGEGNAFVISATLGMNPGQNQEPAIAERRKSVESVLETDRSHICGAEEEHRGDANQQTQADPGSNGHGTGKGIAASQPRMLAPLRDGDICVGVVEIIPRAQLPIATQEGHLRFLDQACDIASEFFKLGQLRRYRGLEQAWRSTSEFCEQVHASLSSEQVAFAVANEGRRLAGCGRISVTLLRRKRQRLITSSGQDQVDSRSNAVHAIEQLAELVCAIREPLWLSGETPDLPPQIEEASHAVLEATSARQLGVIPLLESRASSESQEDNEDFGHVSEDDRKVLGALIVEEYSTKQPINELAPRLQLIGQHAERALTNAWQHERLFGLPVWRFLGRSKAVTALRNLPVTLTVAGVLLAVVLGMALIPAEFQLEGRGVVQPLDRAAAFARGTGDLEFVGVDHGDRVTKGQELARIHDATLAVQIEAAVGQKNSLQEQIVALEKRQRNRRLPESERREIPGELARVQEDLAGTEAQLRQLLVKQDQLRVLSPIDGEIVSWDVRNQLTGRPVTRGDLLFEIADAARGWELEVRMPEDRMAHVVEAQRASGEELPVTFIMANDPGTSYTGRLTEIELRAESSAEEGAYVMVRVAFDAENVPHLRPGSEVIAKVHCGQRSLAYVWLGDAWEWFESRVLFRF